MSVDAAAHSANSKKFRGDIEGLRAFAVIPVLLFHANFTYFYGYSLVGGGFVGVDVFFVISGYLISGYIYKGMFNKKNYSIVEFYNRRIKRLFPAIFAVYIFCLIVSGLSTLPSEMAETRTSVWSSILFSSNMYFASKAGYFGGALNSNPLLHTWSLSVEEQFYIVFPLALLVLRPLSHRWRVLSLAGIALASLIFAQYLVLNNADHAYYSLFARFWELLLGSLLAISDMKAVSRRATEGIVAAGLLAIIYSITQYHTWTRFPGLNALVPCLGTAAVLYGGGHRTTLTSRIVALPPFRFIGKISYSLYLWHWPLIVYCRLLYGDTHSGLFVALALSFAAAWLSWRFVEQPFRNLSFPNDRFAIIKGGVAAAVLTVVASFAAMTANARVFPETPQKIALQSFVDHYQAGADMRDGVCFLNSNYNDIKFFQRDRCLAYRPGADNVLLLGDSHSAQYFLALKTVLSNANVMQASASGCLPLLDAAGEKRCTALWQFATQSFLPTHHVDAIVLGGLWEQSSIKQITDTARWLTQFAGRVYIIGPNPEYLQDLPRLMMMAQYKGKDYVTRQFDPGPARMEALLTAARLPPRVIYLSYYQAMCRTGCPLFASDGKPATFDSNHLTRVAATDAVRQWSGLLQSTARLSPPTPRQHIPQ